jgi:YVTN family beta-propeller protein
MLFTDIEGSTRLLTQLGERYGELLADQRRILRHAFREHGGREMDTQGDAFFYAFARARNAIEAAVDAQRGLGANEWPDQVECRVRMGLHTGEPSVNEEGYHGIGLHRGARIAAAGHGGQILLSNTTAELVQDDLPTGVSLRDLGEQRLKDIDRPERVFQLVADGLQSSFPPLKTQGPSRRRPARPAILAGAAALAAAVLIAVFLGTRGSSGPEAAVAAPVAANSLGILDPSSGRLSGQVDVGASPGATAACSGSIWTANVDAHTVSRIDPARQVVIQTVQVGNGPDGVTCGGGFVWVSNGLDGTVTQIDPTTDTAVNTIVVGNGPAGEAVGSPYVWVANSYDGSVTRIDLRTDKPLPPIAVGQSADGIAVGYGSVWVTSEVGGTVTRIDERSGSVTGAIQAEGSAGAIATGAGAVWVANDLDDTVTRIDPVSGQVSAAIPVGDGPSGIAVTEGSVWISNVLGGTLSRIAPATNTVVQTIATGNRPEDVVFDSGSLFVAVRATGRPGGTLRVLDSGNDNDLHSVDPALAYSYTEWQIVMLTNDGLTGYRRVGGSAGTRLVPDLAVSLPAPTDGGLTYTFRLRRGIHYSTGAEVEPSDIRRGIERSFDLAGAAYYAPYFGSIRGATRCLAAPKQHCDLSKGIEADDASHSITFHLTRPDSDFLDVLALPEAYAVPAGTPLRPQRSTPATGPYEVASFRAKDSVRLVRNPRFHEWSEAAQPSGYPDGIVLSVAGSPNSRVSAVLNGNADLVTQLNAGQPSPAVRDAVRTQHASLVEINPWPITWYLALNTRVAPFDDVDVRRAVSFALDRQRLLDLTLGQGFGQVTCQVLPPNFIGYRKYCPYTVGPRQGGVWTGPNLAQAHRLVRASGTAGQAVTLWVPSYTSVNAAAARYVVSTLDALGYRAHFRFTNSVLPKAQISFAGWYPDYPTPGGFITPTLSCGAVGEANVTRFCDPAIDRQIARATSVGASDPQTAYRLWVSIDRQITNLSPWVSYANGGEFELASARIGNYQLNPQWGSLLDQIWLK